MGQLLTLSWLVRVQVGAKRGRLTLLGELRGAKLELKGALETSQETPKWPKNLTAGIDRVARGSRLGYFWGPGPPPK